MLSVYVEGGKAQPVHFVMTYPDFLFGKKDEKQPTLYIHRTVLVRCKTFFNNSGAG